MHSMDPANLLGSAIAYLGLVDGANLAPSRAGDSPTASGITAEPKAVGAPRTASIVDFTMCTKRFTQTSEPVLQPGVGQSAGGIHCD